MNMWGSGLGRVHHFSILYFLAHNFLFFLIKHPFVFHLLVFFTGFLNSFNFYHRHLSEKEKNIYMYTVPITGLFFTETSACHFTLYPALLSINYNGIIFFSLKPHPDPYTLYCVMVVNTLCNIL